MRSAHPPRMRFAHMSPPYAQHSTALTPAPAPRRARTQRLAPAAARARLLRRSPAREASRGPRPARTAACGEWAARTRAATRRRAARPRRRHTAPHAAPAANERIVVSTAILRTHVSEPTRWRIARRTHDGVADVRRLAGRQRSGQPRREARARRGRVDDARNVWPLGGRARCSKHGVVFSGRQRKAELLNAAGEARHPAARAFSRAPGGV
jgi:hypothetical protein